MELRLPTPTVPRLPWTTGLRLEQLWSPEVEVTAESFFPIRRNGGVVPTAIPVREPMLPNQVPPNRFTVLLGDRPPRSRRQTHQLLVTLGALAAVRSAGGSRSPRRTSPVVRCGQPCGGWPSPAGSAGCTTTSSMNLRTYAFPPLTRGCDRWRRPAIRNRVLLWVTRLWYKTSTTSRSQR
jgi:hypothetical protein